jgi:hypothetical protein
VSAYTDVKNEFVRGDAEKVGLKVGKFCETLLRFLQETTIGSHTPFGTPIKNFVDECRKIELTPSSAHPEGLRILMPRALVFAYSVRSKRGVGHAYGDIDANSIDSATCARIIDWCLCELIRIYHKLPLEEAQALLNSTAERQIPAVWNVMGRRRVLKTGLTAGDQALLLLYATPDTAVAAEDLTDWTGYSSLRHFKRDVLATLHKRRLVEHDSETDMVLISPTGIARAELLLTPSEQ